MKIYKSCYRNHWFSPYTVLEYMFFWTAWSKCGRDRSIVDDADYVDHPAWVERATKYLGPICHAVRWVLDLVHPPINYIRIDPLGHMVNGSYPSRHYSAYAKTAQSHQTW
jgi:hypothetical protein